MENEPTRILLIEDNPGDVRLIQEMLKEAAGATFEVVCVERLSTGLEHLSEGGIDILLLDLGLPDSQGVDTFAKVHGEAPQVPIIVLTGLDDDVVAVTAVGAGAQDYLVKGQVDGSLLVRSIRYAIERKRAEEEIRKLGQFRESIIENANVWLDVLDEKANVVVWNKAAEEISGYSREEVEGHGMIWQWLYPDEQYRNEVVATAVAIIERGHVDENAETTIR